MMEKGLKPVIYGKDKAVSPIIATILLVAITVILASTLYLALGGFFSHTASAAPTASITATMRKAIKDYRTLLKERPKEMIQ